MMWRTVWHPMTRPMCIVRVSAEASRPTTRPTAAAPAMTDAKNHAAGVAHALTRKAGSSFYCAFLMLPKERREAILTVYAWCRLSDDIVDGPEVFQSLQRALTDQAWIPRLLGDPEAKPRRTSPRFRIPEDFGQRDRLVQL